MTDPLSNCYERLWRDFEEATEADGRGLFLRVGDDRNRTQCIFRAVALLVVPLVVEVARLRGEVADLRSEVETSKGAR